MDAENRLAGQRGGARGPSEMGEGFKQKIKNPRRQDDSVGVTGGKGGGRS